jgi:hypothetical protein
MQTRQWKSPSEHSQSSTFEMSQDVRVGRSRAPHWCSTANARKDALLAFDAFVETWGIKYDKAVEQGLRYGEIMKEYPHPGGTLQEEKQATNFMPFAGTEGYNPVGPDLDCRVDRC